MPRRRPGKSCGASTSAPSNAKPRSVLMPPPNARSQAQVGEYATGGLQRLHFGGHRIGLVHHGVLREIAQAKAAGAQPPRQIHILAIHEEPGVEATHRIECRASQHDGGAAEPWRGQRDGVIGFRMLVGDLAQFPGRHIVAVAGGGGEQRREDAGLDHAVLVQYEQPWRTTARRIGVVSATETGISGRVNDAHLVEACVRLQCRSAPRCRRKGRDPRCCRG